MVFCVRLCNGTMMFHLSECVIKCHVIDVSNLNVVIITMLNVFRKH